MKRISFDPQFVNEAGNDLVPGKIHSIRRNFDFWKRFEGQEVALFTWEGKPYRSRQKVFCVKRIVSVQETWLDTNREGKTFYFYDELLNVFHDENLYTIAKNDGFVKKIGQRTKRKLLPEAKELIERFAIKEFKDWFADYPDGKMAILQFTDFRY